MRNVRSIGAGSHDRLGCMGTNRNIPPAPGMGSFDSLAPSTGAELFHTPDALLPECVKNFEVLKKLLDWFSDGLAYVVVASR